MLCRTFQTGQKTGLIALGCATALLGTVWQQAVAQNMPVANPGWAAVEQGAKQFVMDTYKLEAALVTIQPMDSRIKMNTCAQDIVFDQPYGNKQSVRARCAQPVWQHFVMVQVKTGLGAQFTNATQTNAVSKVVWVSTQAIKRGTSVQPGMFKNTEITVPAHETRFVSDERELANTELLRDLPANTPLKMQDLKPATMVRRGQQVTVAVGGEGKGFLITVKAEAQQDGLLGEQIRLKNPESGRSLTAVVTGMNMARGL
ncbi:MAG: flagellar basal body P-ring formation chaperone FlgA [Methylotenera sp.]|jgi:flagella basal body P-ring formation protein FlgA|nr:flagellar basal body P-ring formation chaperone FlgA [Methylotenera sp.]